jgi:hypothetical protein
VQVLLDEAAEHRPEDRAQYRGQADDRHDAANALAACRLPPAACVTSVDMNGIRTPPPTPCTARKAMRLAGFQARLESTDPMRKIVRAISHRRLLPSIRCVHPVIGMVTAIASR